MNGNKQTLIKIINAAMNEFSKHGFAKTSIQNIAHAADVGKGTVYEYFKSKDELFNRCFEKYIQILFSKVQLKINDSQSPVQKLRKIFLSVFEEFEKHKDFFVIYLEYMIMQTTWLKNEKTTEVLSNLYKNAAEMIVNIFTSGEKNIKFKSGIEIKNLAKIITGFIDAIMLYKMINPEMIDIESSIETIINLIKNSMVQR